MLTKTVIEVAGKTRYKFKDENSGRDLSGAKIYCKATPVNEADRVGEFQTELALNDYHDFDLFAIIPGVYEVEMAMLAGKGGAKFVIQSATLLPDKK